VGLGGGGSVSAGRWLVLVAHAHRANCSPFATGVLCLALRFPLSGLRALSPVFHPVQPLPLTLAPAPARPSPRGHSRSRLFLCAQTYTVQSLSIYFL